MTEGKAQDKSLGKEGFAQQFISVLLILLCSTILMVWSWKTWPDVIVDYGRELYIPWQLISGKVLYTDIAYFGGPFSPYINALLFSVFGVSISTLAVSNFILVNLLALIIVNIAAYLSNRIAGLLLGILFLSVFAFSQYVAIGNYNFMAPYSYDLTYGVAVSFIVFLLMTKFLQEKELLSLVGLGLLTGLVFLTKPEVFIAVFGAVATGLGLFAYKMWLHGNRVVKIFPIFLGSMLVAPLIAFLLLSYAADNLDGGLGIFTGYINTFNSDISSLSYYKRVSGFDDVGKNLLILVESASIFFIVLGVFSLFTHMITARSGTVGKTVFILCLIVLAYGAYLFREEINWFFVVRGFPLILCVIILMVAFRFFRDKNICEKELFFITLSTFCLLLLLKIILYTKVFHYGFALSMPAVMVVALFIVHFFPEAVLADKTASEGVKLFSVVALMLFIYWHVERSTHLFNQKTVIVGNSSDEIRADWRGEYVKYAVDKISEIVKPDESLAVFPEGIMINYLTRLENPTPYINFMPPELLMFGEDSILESFSANPPDYVAIVHKDTSEYGYKYFGKDYALELGKWIDHNYSPFGLIGDKPLENGKYGILLMRRSEGE